MLEYSNYSPYPPIIKLLYKPKIPEYNSIYSLIYKANSLVGANIIE